MRKRRRERVRGGDNGEYVTFSSVQHNFKIINPDVNAQSSGAPSITVICYYVLGISHRILTCVLCHCTISHHLDNVVWWPIEH